MKKSLLHYCTLPSNLSGVAAASVLMLALSPAGTAAASELLAKEKNCLACHQITNKVIGPAYKDIASRYAGDPSAAGKLADSIMKGSSGKWGPTPMPPNGQVSAAEAAELSKWILSIK